MTDPLITDGRTARRERNRTAVLDAVVDLFGEGSFSPTPDQVATRSGVSLRSVYRYFDDRESLLRSAMDHHFLRIQPLFALRVDADADLDRRVTELVSQRLRLYEAAAPVFRAAIARAGQSALIDDRVRVRRELLSHQVRDLFAAELGSLGARGPEVEAMVDTITEFEAIDYLRQYRGLTTEATVTTVARTVTTLLRSA